LNLEIFKGKNVFITGGTGTFGQAFTNFLLKKSEIKKICIFSRGEAKQHEMKQKFNSQKIKYIIGDVRDKERLCSVLRMNNIHYIIHAAAQKHVPSCENNITEAINTNIIGTQNIVNSSIDCGIEKVIAISTDKAVNPINVYGVTKAIMEKLIIHGNTYSNTRFSCVRYGNVMNSRGSVISIWKKSVKEKKDFTLTDKRMTRFWLTISQAVDFVCNSFNLMEGGEIFIPKLPSMNLLDLAKAIDKNYRFKITGIRPGEKLHEILINQYEAMRTIEFKNYYIIYPEVKPMANMLDIGFVYSSNNNENVIEVDEMRRILDGYN
jgi:UDP-N-acetylglucosamine 4,6-dehydratase